MFLRKILFLISIVFFTSCQFFSSDKNKNRQEIDTVVNFSKVDISPSFAVCDSLIDKTKKDNCFRTSIHQIIAKKLAKTTFKINQNIDETIVVNLLINSKGKISLKSIESSKIVAKEIPELDSLLALSLQNLPKLHPALKRGIPVATQYQLPIKILFDDEH